MWREPGYCTVYQVGAVRCRCDGEKRLAEPHGLVVLMEAIMMCGDDCSAQQPSTESVTESKTKQNMRQHPPLGALPRHHRQRQHARGQEVETARREPQLRHSFRRITSVRRHSRGVCGHRCGTVCGTVRYGMARYSTAHSLAVQYVTVQHSSVRYHKMQ